MIKLVDQLSAMGSFPIATAQDIVCSDNIRLQEKIDNGTLGGGGGSTATTLTQEEYDALDSQEQLEGEFYCYDSARHFRNSVEYGKAVDISGKQDDLHKVKFTMRRNSVNEPRYCLIGSSDLTKTLLMNEPYRFDGTFGSNNNIEKSITSFTVSFKEGVGDPSRILRGFTNNAEGFKYVDLLITVDETENLAYAYVDFLQENSLASGEITKPFLDAESYMDFAESFELVDTYKGTLVCKMSDYCKVITEISDEVSDSTVWSSKKTSDKIDGLISDTSSTTSTYSSAKIDEKINDTAKLVYFSRVANRGYLKITNADDGRPISISDVCGGKIEIYGSGRVVASENYYFAKVLRLSYGNWTTFDATKDTVIHKKIFKTYFDETNKTFYVEVSTHARFCVEGAKTVEMLELDDVDIAQFTEIPESAFASISDSSTGDTTSTWSSSKIASELKTSSNTEKTTIVPNTAYFTQTVDGQPSYYVVRNGVCYVNLDMVCVAEGSGVFQTILPKPIDIINIPISPFNTTEKHGILLLFVKGVVQSFAMTTGERYMANFSYPIA